jgi:hypothetical protein
MAMAQLTYRSPGRTRIAIIGAVAVVLAGVAVTLLPKAAGPPQPARQATAAPSSAQPPVEPSAADVTWLQVAGVDLPFSRLHGPRITTSGQAAGYSRSEQGAAVAAVQVLIRTSAAAGPEVYGPVLATQVTGANLPAMKLAVEDDYQHLRASRAQSQATGNARVAGYLINAYDADAGTATVDVVVTSPDLAGRYVSFRVALVWSHDDWLVLAPPSGSWGSVATVMGPSPAGLLDYGEMT